MTKNRIIFACLAAFALFAAGCNSVQQVLKSNDPDRMYEEALRYYEKEKWSRASSLFEVAEHHFDGTPREDSVAYLNAYCKFKNREYEVAAPLFDTFRRDYGRSLFIEDAEGLLALCYFYMSPGPTRDQSMTMQALVSINEFLSRYPYSSRIEDFREMDRILTQRLHDKSYLNAYTYYKIGRYKAAIVALKNAIKAYPESSHREEMLYLTVLSSYKLAENSVSSKQVDRYLSTLDSYYTFVAEYPESEYSRELKRIAEHTKNFLDKNNTEKQ